MAAISAVTLANSDVIAGQKFYSANYLALIVQLQAFIDDVIAKAVTLTEAQTISGAITFTGNTIVPDQTAGNNSTKAANTKYVDAQVSGAAGHDGDGYAYYDVDGSKAKVYTKYFTGTLDADASTSVAHGITGIDNILHVSVMLFNDSVSQYYGVESHKGASAGNDFLITLDGTNVIISGVGAYFQGNNYRIKLDYIV